MKKKIFYSIPTSSFSLERGVGLFSYIRKHLLLFVSAGLSVFLISCASEVLKAPCPDYGKNCEKTPINSWDTSSV